MFWVQSSPRSCGPERRGFPMRACPKRALGRHTEGVAHSGGADAVRACADGGDSAGQRRA